MKSDLHLRIDKKLKADLQKAADKDHRTLSNKVSLILSDFIKNNKKSR